MPAMRVRALRVRVPEQAPKYRLFTFTRVITAAILGWAAAHYFPVQRFISPAHGPAAQVNSASLGIEAQSRAPFGHPYFPYSVIPGGAHSQQELENALENDSIVASHYADFLARAAHVVRLDQDRQYYVSYRVGDKIYWTRHALTLHKGEPLLFDGVHYARVRCGNRLSQTPSEPQIQSAQAEPNPKVFNAPVTIQASLKPQVPNLDPAPDLPFEIASSRIEGLPDPLANLAGAFTSAAGGGNPETADYVPTQHDRVTLFALDGPGFGLAGAGPLTAAPILYPSGTPPVSSVPEPDTGALAGWAFLTFVAILGFSKAKRRRLMPVRSNVSGSVR